MTQTRTTIKFNGVEYPFYKTNRGSFDFSNAGYTPQQMAEGRVDAMLAYIYFQLRDCARRAGMPFTATLDEFVDNTDDDVLEVYGRLTGSVAKEGEAPEVG